MKGDRPERRLWESAKAKCAARVCKPLAPADRVPDSFDAYRMFLKESS